MWNSEVWKSSGSKEHLKKLEQELKKKKCFVLDNHLRCLRVAWGKGKQAA